jgi:hypothetical protein
MFGAVIADPNETKGAKAQIIESALYYFDTEDASEAAYVASWLNSSPLDGALQPFRRKSQGRQPHVHKKVWEMPVPPYNRNAPMRQELARLGLECSTTAQTYLDSLPANIRQGSLGRLRNMIREKLRPQLDETDELVHRILER